MRSRASSISDSLSIESSRTAMPTTPASTTTAREAPRPLRRISPRCPGVRSCAHREASFDRTAAGQPRSKRLLAPLFVAWFVSGFAGSSAMPRELLDVLGVETDANLSRWLEGGRIYAADGKLQSRIHEAIRRGRDNLGPHLGRLVGAPTGRDHGPGRVALVLTALLKSGMPAGHPMVESAFAKLGEMDVNETYDVACYLFALDALVQRQNSGAFVGRTAAPRASAAVKGRMQELVDWLVAARAEGQGTWSYGPVPPGSTHHDYSNTQFAVLGLQIGIRHQIKIPRIVFEEIARKFIASQVPDGEERPLRLTLEKDEPAKGKPIDSGREGRTTTAPQSRSTTTVVSPQVSPAGWDYTASRRSPYASMTAAGASSLLIARGALGTSAPADISRAMETALLRAYGWIDKNFDRFFAEPHYFYTLYSLEKVGDLGRIVEFDGKDWYTRGATLLVDQQRADGSWGSYIDTSLALLFLTRATKLDATLPVILTSADGKPQDALDPDFVYIREIENFVSARATLEYLASARDVSLIRVVERMVAEYRPDRRGNLAAPLLALWTSDKDRVTEFGKRALADVTGLPSKKRDEYVRWSETWEALVRCEESVDSSGCRRIIEASDSAVLLVRAAEICHRRSWHESTALWIEKLLAIDDGTLRRRVHGYLALWTGAEIRAPEKDDRKSWSPALDAWRSWWSTEREPFSKRIEANQIVAEIERATAGGLIRAGSADEREILARIDRLVTLGDAAKRAIEAAIRKESYSFYLHEARERLEGRAIDLRESI
jgi:hypothetical protein